MVLKRTAGLSGFMENPAPEDRFGTAKKPGEQPPLLGAAGMSDGPESDCWRNIAFSLTIPGAPSFTRRGRKKQAKRRKDCSWEGL